MTIRRNILLSLDFQRFTPRLAAVVVLGLVVAALVIKTTAMAPARPVSGIEARILLDRAVAHAAAGNLDALCRLGGSVNACRDSLGLTNSLPVTPPSIVDSYPAAGLQNGHVLVLEGDDGLGNRYRTKFVVYRSGSSRIVAANPVFWSATE